MLILGSNTTKEFTLNTIVEKKLTNNIQSTELQLVKTINIRNNSYCVPLQFKPSSSLILKAIMVSYFCVAYIFSRVYIGSGSRVS